LERTVYHKLKSGGTLQPASKMAIDLTASPEQLALGR
jgi:hypothetical protein